MMHARSRPDSWKTGRFRRHFGSIQAKPRVVDVDLQGRFFIMLKNALQPRELRIVKNWGSELF